MHYDKKLRQLDCLCMPACTVQGSPGIYECLLNSKLMQTERMHFVKHLLAGINCHMQ